MFQFCMSYLEKLTKKAGKRAVRNTGHMAPGRKYYVWNRLSKGTRIAITLNTFKRELAGAI